MQDLIRDIVNIFSARSTCCESYIFLDLYQSFNTYYIENIISLDIYPAPIHLYPLTYIHSTSHHSFYLNFYSHPNPHLSSVSDMPPYSQPSLIPSQSPTFTLNSEPIPDIFSILILVLIVSAYSLPLSISYYFHILPN